MVLWEIAVGFSVRFACPSMNEGVQRWDNRITAMGQSPFKMNVVIDVLSEESQEHSVPNRTVLTNDDDKTALLDE